MLTDLKLLSLPIGLQLALGAGYVAYLIAYAGLRRGHSAVDATFMALAFGTPALLIYQGLASDNITLASAVGAGASLASGILWRVAIKPFWGFVMSELGVHDEDGASTAWDSMIQRNGLLVQQVAVRLKDGRTLLLNRRDEFLSSPHKGLILGGDGAIAMVVQEEIMEDGTRREPPGLQTENGTRLTYVPVGEIKQVSMRVL